MNKQRHLFGPVVQTQPANTAVTEAGDHPAAIGADVDRPSSSRNALLPKHGAIGAEMPQKPLATEHKAAIAGRHREAARHLAGLDRQCAAIEARRR
jgi:hypothetical protein